MSPEYGERSGCVVALTNLADFFGQLCREVLVDRLFHIDASDRDACLARVEQSTSDGSADGTGDRRVR